MEKITVSVRVPALGGTYDFVIPNSMSVRDALLLMLRILSSEYGVSENSSGVMLIDLADQNSLHMECSFDQLGISDGANLLMI